MDNYSRPSTLSQTTILQVAIAAPLHRLFDYLPPTAEAPSGLEPGMRLKVPFGRGFRVGILVSIAEHSDIPLARLKRVANVLDASPVINAELLGLLRWASDYYRHPIGEVCHAALPKKNT